MATRSRVQPFARFLCERPAASCAARRSREFVLDHANSRNGAMFISNAAIPYVLCVWDSVGALCSTLRCAGREPRGAARARRAPLASAGAAPPARTLAGPRRHPVVPGATAPAPGPRSARRRSPRRRPRCWRAPARRAAQRHNGQEARASISITRRSWRKRISNIHFQQPT